MRLLFAAYVMGFNEQYENETEVYDLAYRTIETY